MQRWKYGFSETELAEYVQTAADYKKMKELCLYARLSKRPLAEVVSFSEVYPKGRLRMVLGLTPQKLFDKTIELRADRLWEKMQIERHAVIDIIERGVPETEKENADQDFSRYPVYIHWTGIIPDRSKCRIYAGR